MAKPIERPTRRTNFPHQGGMYSAGSTAGLPLPPAAISTGDSPRDEALARESRLLSRAKAFDDELLAFHDRKDWKALGYPTFDAWVSERLDLNRSTVFRHLARARAASKSDTINIGESHRATRENPSETFVDPSPPPQGPSGRRGPGRPRKESVPTPKPEAVDRAIQEVDDEREPGCDDDRDETPPRVHVCPGCALRFTEAEEPPDA
jgi:hypothetical protein